ncbi:DNA primase DnaG [Natronorarus salvus]|uniref:DNA primase DnaG n=1 Tax=Natronorarus salvus TaxID=3117733 RepID=UPI002F26D358
MHDTAKYLIHADITASGVVERSDVVGAVFGQTEGLLGDDLDLHDLQQSSKVGRIDVRISSERGVSRGEMTIASSMDKVETAVLAAALETIERVGPCRSTIEVTRIEDVRAATRREVVERATTILSDTFDDTVMSSEEMLTRVRESVRVGEISEYEGYPAGPNVADGGSVILVEGRSDVLTLLRYGIKNAVAVEGTDVPEAVAALTRDRTATAFLDGDRGGELIMKELAQVADIDAVAFAPPGGSVEDLSRDEVMDALRKKVPYEAVVEAEEPLAAAAARTQPAAGPSGPETNDREGGVESDDESAPPDTVETSGDGTTADAQGGDPEIEGSPGPDVDETAESDPETLRGHVEAVIGEGTGSVRLLTDSFESIADEPVEEAFETVRDAETRPYAVVLDGTLTQRILDVAAQRGVEQVLARDLGEFTKRPTSVRLRTADELEVPA